jgi:membrane protein
MGAIVTNLWRAVGRVLPDCATLSQAIAFNMFLAFFPLLLLALGLLGGTSLFPDALKEIPHRLMMIIPPGSSRVVAEYFVRRAVHPWTWFSLGLIGTLLAGSQVMLGFMEGFRLIEGDLIRPGYWRRQWRAVGLLCLTIVPMLAVTVLTVFGKQYRSRLFRIASPRYAREIEIACYMTLVFVLAMAVLVLLYRIGRPGHSGIRELLPGAVVSTALWWTADIGFGAYVRRMPYDFIYRGLASAIGLLLWMFLTAVIVLLGAAYNAEAREASTTGRSVTILTP